MAATLTRDFSRSELERLDVAAADLSKLSEQLEPRREKLFHQAAEPNRLRELHDGRADYLKILEVHQRIVERFQALAETVNSPLSSEFEAISEQLRQQRESLEQRWRSFEDLYALALEGLQPSSHRLQTLTVSHPPPESWMNETMDPFAAEQFGLA